MSLADRVQSIKGGSNQGLPCSVGTLLNTLPKKDAAELRRLLESPWRIVPHNALERAIRGEGHDVGTGSVGKHRRGDCRCGK